MNKPLLKFYQHHDQVLSALKHIIPNQKGILQIWANSRSRVIDRMLYALGNVFDIAYTAHGIGDLYEHGRTPDFGIQL